jgi:hypothetical protein
MLWNYGQRGVPKFPSNDRQAKDIARSCTVEATQRRATGSRTDCQVVNYKQLQKGKEIVTK